MRTGKRVAVIGSGPAGLACAQQLARAGHDVHVYEKWAKAGGLMRYGIPDFKMEKHHIDRRIAQMEAEGVIFHYGAHVGVNIDAEKLVAGHDAVVLTGGAEKARDLPVPGRELKGVHFAMEFLPQQNRRVSGEAASDASRSSPAASTSWSSAAATPAPTASAPRSARARCRVTNFEILPAPPLHENKALTWPNWPLKLRTSSSHDEGAERDFAVMTTRFSGANGHVKKLHCVHVNDKMQAVPGSEFEIDADLVLLAMGFVHPVHEGLVKSLNVALDQRGNVSASTDDYRTSVDKIFAAGDIRRGQSLVVWAIREGRQAARAVDAFLMGASALPL